MIEPRWLKACAAAQYVSIHRKKLIDLARRGIVIGFPDPDDGKGAWIFDRKSLDEYRERQAAAAGAGAAILRAREVLASR